MSFGCAEKTRSEQQRPESSSRREQPTFFADEFLCGGADVVVEFSRLVVIHPPELHAVLLVLPVVRLVGGPGEEILASHGTHGEKSPCRIRTDCFTSVRVTFTSHRGSSIGVNKSVFCGDVVQAQPGLPRHVSCRCDR